MKKRSLWVVLIAALLLMPGPAKAYGYMAGQDAEDLPQDVADFIDRQTLCNHWAGEEPYDKERAKQIEDGMRNARCDALDKDEQVLRDKYSKTPSVIEALDDSKNALM
ncbi:MAG: hypothetical protein SFW62_08320 [Alphaproteobacteria bacterium]|nr:hypothetical protein [Alphaproteobacteria bacterium]